MDDLIIEKNELSPLPTDMLDLVREHSEPLLDFGSADVGLLDALTKLSLDQHDEFRTSDWYEEFYRVSPFDHDDIQSLCTDALAAAEFQENRVSEIEDYVANGLNGVSVLYLPTYRRIEAEMPGNLMKGRRAGRRRVSSQHQRISTHLQMYGRKTPVSSWKTDQLINFGLEDVESKLENIAQSIKSGTFEAYTRIGGRTLEQLLTGPGAIENEPPKIDLVSDVSAYGSK
jgi:hypothetical protein